MVVFNIPLSTRKHTIVTWLAQIQSNGFSACMCNR